MEASNDYGDLPSVLTGNSAIFISDVANAPGKIIKDFRKNQLNLF
jgi:large subunit ribosomal protein L10